MCKIEHNVHAAKRRETPNKSLYNIRPLTSKINLHHPSPLNPTHYLNGEKTTGRTCKMKKRERGTRRGNNPIIMTVQ